MGVIVTLDSAPVEAEPGAEAVVEARIENTGMVVDSILLDLLGDANEWAAVEPTQLNLLPGASETVQVKFKPPRDATLPAGEVPFGLRAMSQEDPDGSKIEEGTVRVGEFSDVAVSIVPKTASGRRHGKFKLVVENRGNHEERLAVSAEDPDIALKYRYVPDVFTAGMGTATFVRLRATPKKRFVKGPSKVVPFQAAVTPEDEEPITVDAAMLQQQTMPEWLPLAIGAVLAVGAAAVAFWFAVLKPTVTSAATTAASQAVSSQASQVSSVASQASQAASAANSAASAANSAAGVAAPGGSAKPSASGAAGGAAGAAAGGAAGAAGSAGAKPSASSAASAPGSAPTTAAPPAATPAASPAAAATPVSGFLQANAAPSSAFATYPFAIPAGKTLNVSDVVLENPAGDTGLLQIRSGPNTLFEFGLANFRSVDYHFVQALQFKPPNVLTLAVQCSNPPGTNCTAAMSFSGSLG